MNIQRYIVYSDSDIGSTQSPCSLINSTQIILKKSKIQIMESIRTKELLVVSSVFLEQQLQSLDYFWSDLASIVRERPKCPNTQRLFITGETIQQVFQIYMFLFQMLHNLWFQFQKSKLKTTKNQKFSVLWVLIQMRPNQFTRKALTEMTP